MISGELIERYQAALGPVTFTLARISPAQEDEVERMLEEAISGVRGPITDSDPGIEVPTDAES